nr:GSTe2 [Pagiophloeus tsushimanus]
MSPKLYGHLVSPPTRAVLMCAKVLGVKLDFVVLDLFAGEHLKDDFLKKNPGHTVPVLEDDDGFVVIDSHAINAYLVEKYGKDDSLYPKDYKLRATIDHRLHFDSSVLFIRGLNISKPLVFGGGVQPDKVRLDALKEALTMVERLLQETNTEYIAGNQLSIADFHFFTSITQWNVLIEYSKFPFIKRYIERIEKLPFHEINKDGLEQYNKLMKNSLKQ